MLLHRYNNAPKQVCAVSASNKCMLNALKDMRANVYDGPPWTELNLGHALQFVEKTMLDGVGRARRVHAIFLGDGFVSEDR